MIAVSRNFALPLLLALVVACTHATDTARSEGTAIRAMTFNIRLDTPSDGENAWPHRREMIFALIRHEAPDVLGLQEVLLHQKSDLAAALPDYTMVGVGRDDGMEKGEFALLAFRSSRFEIVDSGTFWLAPSTEHPGKGWDAAMPRIATWAILRDRTSQRLIRLLNTHFDHVGLLARLESAQMLVAWTKAGRESPLPAIVMGDFNSAPDSQAYAILAAPETSGLSDTRATSLAPPYGPRGTFTGFDITREAPGAIDHIFVTRDFSVRRHTVVTQHWGGRLPSDHYPVLADLRLETR